MPFEDVVYRLPGIICPYRELPSHLGGRFHGKVLSVTLGGTRSRRLGSSEAHETSEAKESSDSRESKRTRVFIGVGGRYRGLLIKLFENHTVTWSNVHACSQRVWNDVGHGALTLNRNDAELANGL